RRHPSASRDAAITVSPRPEGALGQRSLRSRRNCLMRNHHMDWLQALILGVVEGLTEYLPVSSTAHLILAQRALGIDKGEAADAYTVCIQAGAILAVFGIYARAVGRMLRGLAGRDPAGLRLALQLLVAFLPAAVIGLAAAKKIKEHLFGLWPITSAWFVG